MSILIIELDNCFHTGFEHFFFVQVNMNLTIVSILGFDLTIILKLGIALDNYVHIEKLNFRVFKEISGTVKNSKPQYK